MEHLLILTTVERIGDTLPFSPPSQRRRGAPREYLKEYINTLNDVVVLPQIQLHKVIQPLLDLYNNISKTSLTKGCKNRSNVLQRLELVYESKLIILSLFSDYLNFAVPDKSKCLPNHHFQNLFYDFDGDDLTIEELKGFEESVDVNAMEIEQYITEVANHVLTSQQVDTSGTDQLAPPNSPSSAHTRHNSALKMPQVRAMRTSDASDTPPSSPSRAGSFVKRRGEGLGGTNVKTLDDTVAQNLAELVFARLLRGYDMGEENPEHILNCIERFQEYDAQQVVSENDGATPTTPNGNEIANAFSSQSNIDAAKLDYDPYVHGNISRNNIEVFKDSNLRYIERKMRYKCMEVLFKLSCTNFATIYSKIDEVVANQAGATPSTVGQLLEQQLKDEQDREAEEKQEQSSDSEPGDISRVIVSKDDRIPFDETTDVSDGLKVLQTVQYMNFDGTSLSQLFQSIVNQTNKQFIKYVEQFDLGNSLRLAVWNWILNYKTEFLNLYTQTRSLAGASELFDLLYGYQKGKKDRKQAVAPFMALLMLVCPDRFLKAVKNPKSSDNMAQFYNKTLLKYMAVANKKVKEKALTVVIVECFVEIFRVSVMFGKTGEKNAAQLVSEQNEEILRDIFINNLGGVGKYFGLTNTSYEINSTLSVEKELELTSQVVHSFFTKDPTDSVKTILPKLIQSGSILETEALYKRLALSRALLTIIAGPCPRQGSNRIPGGPNALGAVYTAVVSDLKDTLQEIITSYSNMSKKNEIAGVQQDYFLSYSMYDPSEIPAYYSSSIAKKKRLPSPQKGIFLLNRKGQVQTRNRYQCMMETMNTILQLFSADPNFFLYKGTKDGPSTTQNNEKSFLMLANSFVSVRHPEVQEQCVRLFSKLFLDKYIGKWLPVIDNRQDSSAMLRLGAPDQFTDVKQILGFVTVTSSILARLSRALFEEQVSFIIKKIISLIRHITFKCKVFYCKNREHLTGEIVNDTKRLNTLETLASNVLVSLCSPDKDIWKITCRTLRDICDQIELLHNQDIKSLNYGFYRQLSNVDLNADLQNIQYERRNQIQLFRRSEVQTQSSVLAFGEVFRLWRELIKVPNHQSDEWRDKLTNYTSLLCALGGVCLQQQQTKGKSSLDAFMSELMEHVTSSDSLIRQVVTYSVAIDIAPALYEKLFHYMYINMKQMTESSQSDQARTMRVTEQYVYICKTIVDSKDATFDLTLASDLDRLLTLILTYISSKTKKPVVPLSAVSNSPISRAQSFIGGESPMTPTSSSPSTSENTEQEKELVQLKLRLALLIETVMNKSEYISFENEQQFRKKTLNQLIQWTSYFTNKSKKQKLALSTGESKAIDPQYTDLDLNCMRAISALLSGYVLDNDSEQEYSEYFSFLIQYLENTPKSHHTFMVFIKKSLNALLFANVGFSLEYFMTMVYSKDEHVRSTFLGLLGTLMKRRKFGSSDEDDDEDDDAEDDSKKESGGEAASENKYSKILQELFVQYNHRPVFILFDQVKSHEKDDACDAFILTYQSMGFEHLLKLLEMSVQLEVISTSANQPGTLFRANSTASKLMKKYCSRVAMPYLKSVLGPLMDRVCNNPQHFEIDPPKAQDRGEDVNVNIANTKRIIQEFIDIILNTLDSIPYQFREYCRYLFKYVGDKFQMINDPTRDEDMRGTPLEDYELDYSHIAVGGFLFLRLICPAITSPQLYGLTKDLPGNDARRFSIIITKVLQNIANGIFQSKKEAFMQSFEEFTKDNLRKFKKFFTELAAEPINEEERLRQQQNAMPENVSEEELEEAYGTIHRYLSDYQEATRSNLQAFFKHSDPIAAIDLGHNNDQSSEPSAYDVLSSWLGKAGRPPEKKKAATAKTNAKEYSSIIFDQFLQKTGKMIADDKNLQTILSQLANKHVFFIRGMTKKQQHLVYFLPQRLTATELYVHIDIVLYHILTTLQKVFQQQYVLVVDCTLWEPHIEIPFATIVKLSKFMPMGAKKNLSEVVVVNPNTSFKKLLKKFAPMMKKMNQVRIITNVGEKDQIKWEQSLNIDVEKSRQLITEHKKTVSSDSSANQEWEDMLIPLPQHTLNVQNETRFISSVQRVSAKLVKDSQIVITKDTLFMVTTKEKAQIAGKTILYNRVEHFHLDGISEIAGKRALMVIARSKDFQFKYNPNIKTNNDPGNYASASKDALVTASAVTVSLRSVDREKHLQIISDAVAEKSKENESNVSLNIVSPVVDKKQQRHRLKPSDVPGQLLNICFLNLESSNSNTRYAAYNLLTTIIEQFQLPIAGILESDIISVPRNTEDLVLEMSDLVAKHKPDITLEFLDEALNAFTQIEPKSQVMCAKYIKPWIHNLSLFYFKSDQAEATDDKKKENEKKQIISDQHSGKVEANSQTHKRLAEWFLTFTRVSCQSSQVFPAIAELWTLISQENQSMLYMGLEAAIEYGVEMGSVEADQSLVTDLVVTLSVHCPPDENVALRIMNSIMEHLIPSSASADTLNIYDLVEKEANEIYNDKKWSKIIIYLRFLMNLSFQNRLNVLQNLPVLLNLIVMLVGLGQDVYIRSTLHALCCNIIHSLLIELPFLTSSDLNKAKKTGDAEMVITKEMEKSDKLTIASKQNVINCAKKLKDKKSIRGIFMGSANIEPVPFAKLATNSKKLSFDVCNMYKIETLVRFLMDTLANWEDHWNGLWKVEWQQLCKSTLENAAILESTDSQYHLFYARSLMTYSILACEKPSSDYDSEDTSSPMIINNLLSSRQPLKKELQMQESVKAYGDTTDFEDEEEHKEHLSKLGHNIIIFAMKFLSKQNLLSLMPSTAASNDKKNISGSKHKQQQDLLLSVVLTLGRFCKKMRPSQDAQQLHLTESLFLTGIMLLAIVDVRMFNAVIRMLSCVLSTLYECGVFDGYSNLSEYMNHRIRQHPNNRNTLCGNILEEFEQVIGISFKEHFSFALSVLVMKALVVEGTRDDAAALLKQFHMIQNKLHWHPRESLGYFCGLIPFDRQYNTPSFCEFMFQREVFEHESGTRVFLFQKYLFALVNEIKEGNTSLNNEQAMLCIYRTLNRGFDSKIRSLFNDVFKDHHSMSHVVRTYTSSENDKIIEASMNLFKSMSNDIRGSALSMKEPFLESGFASFKKHRNFKIVNGEELQAMVVPCQTLFCKLLQTITDCAEVQQIPEQSASAAQSIDFHRQRVLEHNWKISADSNASPAVDVEEQQEA